MAYVNGDPVNNIDIDGLYASNTFNGKHLSDGSGRLPGAPEEEKPKPKAPSMDFATWGALQFARLEAAQNQSQLNNSPNVKYASSIGLPNDARQNFADKHGNYQQLARGNASSDYTIESLVIPLFKGVGWLFKGVFTGKVIGMSNAETRIWYNNQLKLLNTAVALTEKNARSLHLERNLLKATARNMMKDKQAARLLNKTDPLKPFEFYVVKYTNQGFTEQKLWERIIKGSTTPNATINSKFGLK
jgi:hypothetical protein